MAETDHHAQLLQLEADCQVAIEQYAQCALADKARVQKLSQAIQDKFASVRELTRDLELLVEEQDRCGKAVWGGAGAVATAWLPPPPPPPPPGVAAVANGRWRRSLSLCARLLPVSWRRRRRVQWVVTEVACDVGALWRHCIGTRHLKSERIGRIKCVVAGRSRMVETQWRHGGSGHSGMTAAATTTLLVESLVLPTRHLSLSLDF